MGALCSTSRQAWVIIKMFSLISIAIKFKIFVVDWIWNLFKFFDFTIKISIISIFFQLVN